MSQRIDALKSKLPPELLSLIQSFDSHPTADLIRAIEFERYPGHVYAASSLGLKNCDVWPPLARELRRRLRHNATLMSRTQGVWMPILCYDARTWMLSFPRWQFETLEDLDYLPLWVKEEYRLKVR
jgi:hypothetical protein